MIVKTERESVTQITLLEKESEVLFKELQKLDFTVANSPVLHAIYMSLYQLN